MIKPKEDQIMRLEVSLDELCGTKVAEQTDPETVRLG